MKIHISYDNNYRTEEILITLKPFLKGARVKHTTDKTGRKHIHITK